MAKILIFFALLPMMVFIKNCQGALFYFHRFNPTEIQNQPPPSEVEYKSVSELSKCTHRNSFWLSVGTTDLAINAITVSTLPLDLGRTPRMSPKDIPIWIHHETLFRLEFHEKVRTINRTRPDYVLN